MADAPATKKDLAALQKEVDEIRKWFQDEKAQMNRWFNDEKKFTRDSLAALKNWVEAELDKLK